MLVMGHLKGWLRLLDFRQAVVQGLFRMAEPESPVEDQDYQCLLSSVSSACDRGVLGGARDSYRGAAADEVLQRATLNLPHRW